MLRAAQQHLGLTMSEVWFGYVSVGGNESLRQVQAWLTATEPGDHDHDLLAQSLNDRFVDRGMGHPVAYSESLVEGPGTT